MRTRVLCSPHGRSGLWGQQVGARAPRCRELARPPWGSVPLQAVLAPGLPPKSQLSPGGGGGSLPAATPAAPGERESRLYPLLYRQPPTAALGPSPLPGLQPSPEEDPGPSLAPGRPRGLWAYGHPPAGSGVRSLLPPQGGAAGAGTAAVATNVETGCVRQEAGAWGRAVHPPWVIAPFLGRHPGQSTACRSRVTKRRIKNVEECPRLHHRHRQRLAPHWPWRGPPCGLVRLLGVRRLLLHFVKSFRACHRGPGPHRLEAPLTGAADGALPGPVREAGVGRTQPRSLPPRAPSPAPGRRPGAQGCYGPVGCSGGRGWAPPAQTPRGRSTGAAHTRPLPVPNCSG